MPELKRPDGVLLHWERRGDSGPLVVFSAGALTYPAVYEDLFAGLARDHRVVFYDARGAGESTRTGPYDMATDVADATALLEELGGDAVFVGVTNGGNIGVHVAVERPELVHAVVTLGGVPIDRGALEGSEGFIGSQSVVDMMFELAEHDYRGAARAWIPSVNPQLDEDEVRERVEAMLAYAPAEAVIGRARAWDADRPQKKCRLLGGRLSLLRPPDDPWLSAIALDRVREILPEAHVEEVAEGPLTRPDISADLIRAITAQSL